MNPLPKPADPPGCPSVARWIRRSKSLNPARALVLRLQRHFLHLQARFKRLRFPHSRPLRTPHRHRLRSQWNNPRPSPRLPPRRQSRPFRLGMSPQPGHSLCRPSQLLRRSLPHPRRFPRLSSLLPLRHPPPNRCGRNPRPSRRHPLLRPLRPPPRLRRRAMIPIRTPSPSASLSCVPSSASTGK